MSKNKDILLTVIIGVMLFLLAPAIGITLGVFVKIHAMGLSEFPPVSYYMGWAASGMLFTSFFISVIFKFDKKFIRTPLGFVIMSMLLFPFQVGLNTITDQSSMVEKGNFAANLSIQTDAIIEMLVVAIPVVFCGGAIINLGCHLTLLLKEKIKK